MNFLGSLMATTANYLSLIINVTGSQGLLNSKSNLNKVLESLTFLYPYVYLSLFYLFIFW